MARKILVADLLCGAGGSSIGCARALREIGLETELVCVNHWPVAIETHNANHPEARHYCQDIATARPHLIVPEGYLDLLMASSTCTHHSVGARRQADQRGGMISPKTKPPACCHAGGPQSGGRPRVVYRSLPRRLGPLRSRYGLHATNDPVAERSQGRIKAVQLGALVRVHHASDFLLVDLDQLSQADIAQVPNGHQLPQGNLGHERCFRMDEDIICPRLRGRRQFPSFLQITGERGGQGVRSLDQCGFAITVIGSSFRHVSKRHQVEAVWSGLYSSRIRQGEFNIGHSSLSFLLHRKHHVGGAWRTWGLKAPGPPS
jgi:hypothetical protein